MYKLIKFEGCTWDGSMDIYGCRVIKSEEWEAIREKYSPMIDDKGFSFDPTSVDEDVEYHSWLEIPISERVISEDEYKVLIKLGFDNYGIFPDFESYFRDLESEEADNTDEDEMDY